MVALLHGVRMAEVAREGIAESAADLGVQLLSCLLRRHRVVGAQPSGGGPLVAMVDKAGDDQAS